VAEIKTRKKTFKASVIMKQGLTATYTASYLVNPAPACLGAVTTASTTVTPTNIVGIRNGMTMTASAGMTANYTVANVTTSTFTVSAAATATNASTWLTFYANDLPKFDLSAFAAPGDVVEINNVVIDSSAGAASIKLAPCVLFYNTSAVATAVASAVFTDNLAWTPSFALHSAALQARVVVSSAVGTFSNFGANAYQTHACEISRLAQVDPSGYLHMAILDTNTYVASANETMQVTIKGIVK